MTDNDPNDQLNTQHELASAYLDGVADPAQRAHVEASPELMQLVETFTVVRDNLGELPPVAADTREAAFAAALAQFDTPALAPAAAPAAVIPLRSRRSWARPVLSVAAAVVLIGAIGVVTKGGLSSDDKSSSAQLDSNAKVASADASDEAQMSADTMTAMAPSTIGSIDGGASTDLVVDTPDQLQALSATALGNAALPVAGSPESTVASANTLPAPTPPAGDAYSREALGCLTAQQEFLTDIVYQGISAIAARDTVTGMISAITDDCTVLAAVGP